MSNRNVEITLQFLHGRSANSLAEEHRMAGRTVSMIVRKTTRLSREPGLMTPEEWGWTLADARKHAAYYIKRLQGPQKGTE